MLNVNTPILGECVQSAIGKFIIMPAENTWYFFLKPTVIILLTHEIS
jgi:hypothetical protein